MVSSIHCMCLPFVLLLAQGCDMTEHRLFLLAYPPVGVAGEISRFRDASGLVRRPVPDERLHTTIGMAGTFDKSPRVLIARIRDRLTGCSPPSCRIVLDTIIGGPKSALLKPRERLPGFEALQAGLSRRVAASLYDLGMDVGQMGRTPQPPVT